MQMYAQKLPIVRSKTTKIPNMRSKIVFILFMRARIAERVQKLQNQGFALI